jgi:hypothetical protein
MAKKEEEDDPKEWPPDQPIPDNDGEDTAQKRFMLERRVKHLHDEADKKGKKPAVKKGGWGN